MLTRTADELIRQIDDSPFGVYLDEIDLPNKTMYRTLHSLEQTDMIRKIKLHPFLKRTRIILSTKGQMYAYILRWTGE